MNLPTQFDPPRSTGLIFQIGLSAIFLAAGLFLMFQAVLARVGALFLVNLFFSLLLFAPVPVLVYRAYSLATARYTLERDGLRLRWGLRYEDIPLPYIQWVRRARDFPSLYVSAGRSQPKAIPLPFLRWPGSLIGTRTVEGLGPIEYLASSADELVLVATPQKIYAISPAQPEEFLRAFNRTTELGSLTPLESRSIYPVSLLARVWADLPARWLLAAGLFLGLVLLAWVSMVIPSRASISFGFTRGGASADVGPAEGLLLLPVLDGLSYLAALLGGLFFYRHPQQQLIAYFVWAGNLLEVLFLLASIFFITRA